MGTADASFKSVTTYMEMTYKITRFLKLDTPCFVKADLILISIINQVLEEKTFFNRKVLLP